MRKEPGRTEAPPPERAVGLGGSAPPHDPQIVQAINQRIFDTSLDLILVVDRQGTFLRVSPSSMTILGHRPEDMIGHSAIEFIHPPDLDPTRTEMRLARRGRLTRNFDCRYVHKEGHTVPLTWTGVWSEPEEQHFFIGRDMTERIAAEDRLRHSQRIESIGQLTGGIAHDFNNLLAIIVGNLELLLRRPGLGPEVAKYAGAAMHAAQRGAGLTRPLLAFARQQSLEPKVADANALIGNITTLLSRTIGQHIEIAFIGGDNLWPIFIDPANLESTIANLAVNARDAMPGGGKLVIETGNATLDEDYAQKNPGALPGEYVSVMVSDTGTGMPPEVLNRVFDPFFTTKESGKGTGLGLSMVFGFIKQSNGHIKAYSEVGHGTSFRLYLPRAKGLEPSQAATVGATAEPLVPSTRNECVLVVEDNDGIRELVLLQLARLGYRTLNASSPAEALELLDAGEAVDLLFTDVVMPGGMNGQDLAREASARRPGLKVLFTSGFPGALLAGNDGIASAGAVLGKPYRIQELADKVRNAIDGKSD